MPQPPAQPEPPSAPRPDDPIEVAELPAFFERAARPDPGTHLIGTELETFGVALPPGDGAPTPVRYEPHIRAVLERFESDYGWEIGPDRGEHGEIVELRRGGASITLEPGGQLELSGAPLSDVHQTCAEFTTHYRELTAASESLRLSWMAVGHHPWATRDEIAWMPKGRYRVMRNYLPSRGDMALDMMLRTCTVQANFDYASEVDCGSRLRLMSAVGPVITAMFANSPYVEGSDRGRRSWRSHVWTAVDPDRCGVRPFFFETPFSFERYVDWALDVPMFFIRRQGRYHEFHETFRTFLRDGATVGDLETRAQWHDWTTHLSTLFPEVRLKPHLEFRSADAVGSKYLCALPALLKGLVYDADATQEAWELIGETTFEGRLHLIDEASRFGLGSERIRTRASTLVEISRRGLDRQDVRDSQGRTESRFLDPLSAMIDEGLGPGGQVLGRLGPDPGRSPAGRRRLLAAFHFAGILEE